VCLEFLAEAGTRGDQFNRVLFKSLREFKE